MFSTIQAKIVAAIFVVLILSLSFVTFLTIRNQRTNLLEARQQDVANNSSTLNVSVRNVMLAGEAPIAVGLLNDLSEAPGFETLEVYRRDGSLAFSDFTTLEEVNENLGSEAFERSDRREGAPLSGETLEEVVTYNTPQVIESLGEERLEYYFPILNYQECRACHGTDHFVRGVAYYEVSLASIFGRIDDARNTLVLLYVLIGGAVAFALVTLMQRIVVGPIRQIGTVLGRVGDGDLEVEAKVRGSREFETLSEKINAMIGGLKERNRLEVENSVIDARDQENRKYLDNIAEGLILIDRDHRISEQYSRYVETLFATRDIAGKRFSEFIYPESEGSDAEEREEKRKELDQFLTMVFENTATEMEMIMSINPIGEHTFRVGAGEDAREIVVATDFQRVFGEDGSVERVMAIFEDRTDIVETRKQLESERERYKSDIEHIATLLKTGPEAYSEFERSALQTIEDLSAESLPTGRRREQLLRDLHSLKGTARYLEFSGVAELTHAAEEALSRDDREALPDLVGRLREEMENLRSINEKFRSFASRIAADGEGEGELTALRDQLERMVRDLADELGKEVTFTLKADVDRFPILPKLQNPIIHLVRNAVDHGIEDSYERLTAGKESTAALTLSLSESDSAYIIAVLDDGRGIDFDSVRRRAVEKGVIDEDADPGEKELLKLLFSSSFSTRSEATEVSGRGVGLDVVHSEVRALGGRISVGTKEGVGTRFTVTIPKEAE